MKIPKLLRVKKKWFLSQTVPTNSGKEFNFAVPPEMVSPSKA
jgi:hypothetical protein